MVTIYIYALSGCEISPITIPYGLSDFAQVVSAI